MQILLQWNTQKILKSSPLYPSFDTSDQWYQGFEVIRDLTHTKLVAQRTEQPICPKSSTHDVNSLLP